MLRAVLALLALALPGPAQDVGREPAPAWVRELELPEARDGPAAGGVEFLLQDGQDDLRGARPERYRRMLTRIAGAAGVDSESCLEIEFDPQSEELVLHRVAVHRQGLVSERLEQLELRVLQREKGLEERLYDGRVTALAFLEDVRVGDRIEVAYSLRGRKAVLGERWFDAFPTAWGVDVRRLHRRVLVPAGRELAVRMHGGAPEPQRRELGADRELLWDLRDVAAVPLEENAPSWHEPLPWAQLSEYPDWPSVARWGAQLFASDAAPGAELRALAAQIAGASDDPLERTRLALRRVQADVRYLGLLFGEGSHRPRSPDEVLARRFGDCKDKALLLVTLLAELGVEARPALVSTLELHTVREQLPSPGAFDHAIVRARVAGEELWLDPTQSSERGPLDEHTLPDYGVALLLDPDSGDLVDVVRDRGTLPLTRVDKRYALRVRGPSTLEVRTTYEGARANLVREGLESLAPGGLEDLCLQYLAEQHPHAESAAPPEVEDDLQANRLTVRERYRIPDAFGREGLALVGCVELAGEFAWPVALQRVHPFAVPHPGRFEQHLEVELDGLGPSVPQTTRVSDGAFRFESRCGVSRERLTIDASFETLRDHVHPGQIARYADALERANAALHREVHPPGPAAVGASLGGAQGGDRSAEELGRALGGLVLVALVVLVAASRVQRTKRGAGGPLDVPQDLEGLLRRSHVEGRTLVLARGAELPARCIECNGPGDVRRTVRLRWHSPWLYLLLPALLLYAILAVALSDRDSLRVARCNRHHRRRNVERVAAAVAFTVGLALLLAAIEGANVLGLVGLVLVLTAAVLWARLGSQVRAGYMDARTLHLRGIGRAYLDAFASTGSSSVGNVPDASSAASTAARSAA